MNRTEVYSYLGALLGTGVGFGIGGLLGEVVGYGLDLVFLYFIILFIVLGLDEVITHSHVPGLIFFLVVLPYY